MHQVKIYMTINVDDQDVDWDDEEEVASFMQNLDSAIEVALDDFESELEKYVTCSITDLEVK